MARFNRGELSPMGQLRQRTRMNSVTTFAPSGSAYTRRLGPGRERGRSLQDSTTQDQTRQQDWLQSYYRQLQTQQTEARTANEQRYQQMLGIADKDREAELAGYGAMKRTIAQETGQRAADIRSETEGLVSQEQQRMSRLGLSNVSQPSVYAGIRREGQSNLNRLTDALLGRKLGVQQMIAQRGRGKRLGIMERRTDAYPDTGQMSDLVRMIYEGRGSGGV